MVGGLKSAIPSSKTANTRPISTVKKKLFSWVATPEATAEPNEIRIASREAATADTPCFYFHTLYPPHN